MKASELRDLTVDELLEHDKELSQQLFNLRLQQTTQGQLDNPAKVRDARRDRARVQTVLREKQAS
ncbi:MAG: 50S ribosomal protein L29 [Acidobacteriota bacterium]